MAQNDRLREHKRMADKEVHKCAVCGHDGGIDEIAETAEVVGMSTYRCVDDQGCIARLRRLRRIVFSAQSTPLAGLLM